MVAGALLRSMPWRFSTTTTTEVSTSSVSNIQSRLGHLMTRMAAYGARRGSGQVEGRVAGRAPIIAHLERRGNASCGVLYVSSIHYRPRQYLHWLYPVNSAIYKTEASPVELYPLMISFNDTGWYIWDFGALESDKEVQFRYHELEFPVLSLVVVVWAMQCPCAHVSTYGRVL